MSCRNVEYILTPLYIDILLLYLFLQLHFTLEAAYIIFVIMKTIGEKHENRIANMLELFSAVIGFWAHNCGPPVQVEGEPA